MYTVVVPNLGIAVEEGRLLCWRKRVGDHVKQGDTLAQIEAVKVTIEVDSSSEGVLRQLLAQPGQMVKVGAAIALVGAVDEPMPASAPAEPVMVGERGGRVFISPIARRLAKEHQLDIAHIVGTGPTGRIILGDVEAALARLAAARKEEATRAAEDVEIMPLTPSRKAMARRLRQSARMIPHFSMTVSVNVTPLSELREAINKHTATLAQPVKVSLNDLLIKGVAQALERVPDVNASFDAHGQRIVRHKRVHIGILVARERGPLVVVLRGAERRRVLEIARQNHRLIASARANVLKPEEIQGATFTVNNAGMYGVEEFTAFINPPEVGVLAIGAATPTPVICEGQVVVREVLRLTLSADPRVVDGAIAARFLHTLRSHLEQPLWLLP